MKQLAACARLICLFGLCSNPPPCPSCLGQKQQLAKSWDPCYGQGYDVAPMAYRQAVPSILCSSGHAEGTDLEQEHTLPTHELHLMGTREWGLAGLDEQQGYKGTLENLVLLRFNKKASNRDSNIW